MLYYEVLGKKYTQNHHKINDTLFSRAFNNFWTETKVIFQNSLNRETYFEKWIFLKILLIKLYFKSSFHSYEKIYFIKDGYICNSKQFKLGNLFWKVNFVENFTCKIIFQKFFQSYEKLYFIKKIELFAIQISLKREIYFEMWDP